MKVNDGNTSGNNVRFGVVGVGGMGKSHALNIANGEVDGAVLTSVCDADSRNFADFPKAETFGDYHQMIDSGLIDALIIATPHFLHTPISIAALEKGLHVLVEKPLAVHKADCERTISAFQAACHRASKSSDTEPVFAVMFNMRTHPEFQKIKSLIDRGELGEIRRINWIITDWFRTELYYQAGGWRATWKGEGGGVLLNQCPHQLDLMQWLFGMPEKIRAFAHFGKYHDIEVEDEVSAYLEYPNGATGVFVASTGEAPGTNRVEIAAERGRLILENNTITWTRNEIPSAEFSRTSTGRFTKPDVWNVEVPVPTQTVPQHLQIIRNFTAAILGEEKLLSPGIEGIASVELGNAMLLSALKDRPVTLPMDSAKYERELNRLIAESTFVKKTVDLPTASSDEMKASFK